ncbi:MAG: TolC family protein [Prevotella sp.]|nr:TolC family protein [Prevotella sp.]MCM1075187.1 TolC family protein [Ruminococcus sp.]
MNNQRLLTGCISVLLSVGICTHAHTPAVFTLEQLFEAADANSLQLRPAYSAEKEAEAGVNEACMSRLPEINASLSFAFNGDGFTTKRNLSDYQKAPIPHFGNAVGVNISQPVYAGGAITAGIELAELKLTAARFATELNRSNVRFALTGFYLDIYKYNNLRRVVDENISLANKVLEQMHAKYESGMALHNDITRYELLIENLKLQRIKLDNTLKILNDNLVTLAGLPDNTVIAPDTSILTRSLPTVSETYWRETSLQNAPSIKLARSKVDISKKAEALVRAERMPKVGLQAGWTFEGPILTEVPPINRNLSYWYIGIGVNYNLSSMYKNSKSQTRAHAASVTAFDELDALRQDTELSVRSDYVRYLEAYEELKTQQKSLELAQSNYNVTFTRYTSGVALITDMLDATNSILDAEQRLVNSRIDIIYYYYKLLFTSGTL